MRIISYVCMFALIFLGYTSWKFFSNKRIQNMQHGDTLYVGTNAEYPPFSYREGDEIVGFDIDMVKRVADKLHKKIVIIDMPFDSLIPALQTGMIHMVAAGMTPTKERAQQVFFSPVYFQGDPLVIVTLRTNPIKDTDGLQGKKVIVNEGYTADYYVAEHVACDIIRLPAVNEALAAVQIGRADAYVTALSALQEYFRVIPEHPFMVSVIPDTQERYAFAISKQYPSLAESIEHTVNTLLDDGVVQSLKAQRGLL